MKDEKRNFDREAALWDANPGRLKVAADIAQAMISKVGLNPTMDVLDFGCGTGLLSLALQPFVRSVTGVDNSSGMLDVFRRKISDRELHNVHVRHLDLEKGEVLTGSYHLAVSSLTLHHIREIGSLLKQFHDVLHPSGLLAIADLDSDNGQFHDDNKGVFHFGFDRKALRLAFTEAGFKNIQDFDAARIEKPVDGLNSRVFNIFLMTGRRG